MMRRGLTVSVGLGVALLGVGILGGVVIERVRFEPERAAVLKRYEREVHDWRERSLTFGARRTGSTGGRSAASP